MILEADNIVAEHQKHRRGITPLSLNQHAVKKKIIRTKVFSLSM